LNGTTGYEEAAAQGLIAGINAACAAEERDPLILRRSQAYMGVLVDDLVTRGTSEPYRMFTSRAEYRLHMREDNADLRLGETGHRFGLVSEQAYRRIARKKERIARELERLRKTVVYPGSSTEERLLARGSSALKKPNTLADLLRRPELTYEDIIALAPPGERCSPEEISQVELEVKYEGYIRRQEEEIRRFENMEEIRIPPNFEYGKMSGLSCEVLEKLNRFRPVSLGQASRISGITPVAISMLMIHLRR
jgi:tRNA uridine 5-carboxymethylaminomethyl modification enzyme